MKIYPDRLYRIKKPERPNILTWRSGMQEAVIMGYHILNKIHTSGEVFYLNGFWYEISWLSFVGKATPPVKIVRGEHV